MKTFNYVCRFLIVISLSALTTQFSFGNKSLDSYRDNKMVLKQMWDNREITFERKSDLEFYNSESQFPLRFTQTNGKISEVLAFNKDVWKKVANYTPEVNKEVTVAPAKLKVLEGYYKLEGKDLYLQMRVNGNGLVVREMWSEKEINVAPKSDIEFYGRDFRYPMKFTRNPQSGKVVEVLIFKKDRWVKVDSYPGK